MRPFSPFSRKPLLFIGFISVFIFLYNVASHPKVSETLQPNTFYKNYDEHICLPEHYIKTHPPKEKAKAAFVILVRNREQEDIAQSIMNLEDKFNKNFHYPYVFLNNEPFTEEFKQAMTKASPNARKEFGILDKSTWGYPSWVNESYAADCRKKMELNNVLYGELESYHHMCRFQSGFFFDHPLLDKYEWYWRVEPGVKFFCDITYDPFLYMQKHKKQYGFVVTLTELPNTIPSLWKTVKEYAASRRIDISEKSRLLFPYFYNENDQESYNYCHFWSNFEIASLNLWRSPAYRDFFNYLDQTGNFFYERWGDAPVHSLATGLFLETDQIHYFEDIGYQHDYYRHCPKKESRLDCRCDCPEGTITEKSIDHEGRITEKSIDHDTYFDTCLPQWRKWVKTSQDKIKWNFLSSN